MAVLDKNYNLTEKTYDLNHGEMFTNQYYHWLIHMADYIKSSLGEEHPKYIQYLTKAAKQLDNFNWVTLEELQHYRENHEDTYFSSLSEYVKAQGVPLGKANYLVGMKDVPHVFDLPELRKDFEKLGERKKGKT